VNELTRLALGLQEFWRAKGWEACVIGGLAVQAWGEPRFTMDVDVSLLTGLGREEELVDAWLEKFPSRIPGARTFALENRVLLLRGPEGIGVDVALGCLPFEEQAIRGAVEVELEPGAKVWICRPEDLVVMKAFADRPQDWLDLRGILIRQKSRPLDWTHIRRQLKPLAQAKEKPELVQKLEELRKELGE
jgi:hypothetical protein